VTTLRATQLVYSNVEAEHSPTNRRGFQVWLCSPRLKEHQREIARRLEDFEWPTPDAAANKVTERFAFFRTAAGDFVVARTVPLTERDALRRAGRFHAHAVVVPPGEFVRVGNDPFRVIDGFRFQDGPAAVIAADAWRTGALPDAEVAAGPPTRPDPESAAPVRAVLPLLARWLDGPDDPRPVAVLAPPVRVARFLRAVFRALPPALRAKASFDALSTGQSLGPLPYKFAGGYDGPTVRDWTYRRAYRLDPDAGEFLAPPEPPDPPAAPGLDHLAAQWAADDALTDEDREASYGLLKALTDPAVILPDGATERALDLVRGAPGAAAGFARRVRERVAADVPFPTLQPLVEGPAREWVGPLSADALARLAAPVPAEVLAGWLSRHAEAAPLTPPQAAELERWACDELGRAEARYTSFAQLYLIAVRWQPDSAARFAEIRGKPGWADLLDGWFRDWFLSGSPIRPFLESEPAAAQFAGAVFHSSPRLTAEALPDLERFLAMSDPAAVPFGLYKPLAFAAAFRRADADRMSWLLVDRDVPFARRVLDQARGIGFPQRFGLGGVDGEYPGVILSAGPRADPAAARALFEAMAEQPHVRRAVYEAAKELAARLTPDLVVYPEGALANVERAYEKGRWERVEAELDKLGPSEFRRYLKDRLGDKSRVVKIAAGVVDDGAALWVGPVVESNGAAPELFDGLYKAVLGAIHRTPARESERVAAVLSAVQG
jgi:hypothetical protein